MREKLLFVGMLAMCILYYIEVIPSGNFSTLNWIGFVISAITIVPWLVSLLIGCKKKRQESEYKKLKSEDKKNK